MAYVQGYCMSIEISHHGMKYKYDSLRDSYQSWSPAEDEKLKRVVEQAKLNEKKVDWDKV